MKSKVVLDQLLTYLPSQTSLFNDTLTIQSLTYSSSKVLATTATAHGLLTGMVITIKGALERLQITSITRIGDIATATTATNHDLTFGFQTNVNISGATQTAYNGEHTLLSVPTRKTFTFSVSGSPATPATGTIYLNENRSYGYNGIFQITKLSDTTFEYSVSRDLGVQNGTPTASINPRIFTASNYESAEAMYNVYATGKYALFINIGGAVSNRNRETKLDSVYEYVRGQEYRQTLIQPIDLYVFAPKTETTNAGSIRDVFEDIRLYLIKSLAGAFLNDDTSSDNSRRGITYVDDGLEVFNSGYMVYRYTFEAIYDITANNIFNPLNSIAINTLNIKYFNNYDVIVKNDNKNF